MTTKARTVAEVLIDVASIETTLIEQALHVAPGSTYARCGLTRDGVAITVGTGFETGANTDGFVTLIRGTDERVIARDCGLVTGQTIGVNVREAWAALTASLDGQPARMGDELAALTVVLS